MANDLKVFSGSAHPALASAICAHLQIPLGRGRTIRFSNENLKVKVEENVREDDVFVVQSSCPPVSDGIMELLILIDALRHASARRITAVLPYYPYVRSDKKDEPRISIVARLIADLLQAAGADRVLTLDLHSPQIHGFFHIPVDHMTAIDLLCDYFRARDLSGWVVVASDAGEVKDASRFAARLHLPLAVIDKRRSGDDEQAQAVRLVGEVAGRHALLVDDEVSTAGTLLGALDFLQREQVAGVSAAVVHPVLSGPAPARIRDSSFDELVVTDTIPIPPEKHCPKLQVISVAPLLACAIERIHDGRSVSELFA